jgi:hypothetical protein
VRYSSIDDAVKIIQRLGRRAKLSKCDIKSTFRLLRIFPGDFDQLGGFFRINIILINVSLLEHRSVVLYLKNFQPLFIGSQKFVPVIHIFCIIWMIFCLVVMQTLHVVMKHWKHFKMFANHEGYL